MSRQGRSAQVGSATQGRPAAEPPPPRAEALRLAAVVTALQGVGLIVLSAGFGAYGFVGHPSDPGLLAFAVLLGVLAGVAVALFGRALGRRRRWAVTPTFVLEFLCLPVSWGLGQSHLWWQLVVVAVPALVVLGVLFGPAGRAVARGGD